MYKILLADDERIILEGMAGIIEWESLGASLIGKAQNGHEAYEKIVHKRTAYRHHRRQNARHGRA